MSDKGGFNMLKQWDKEKQKLCEKLSNLSAVDNRKSLSIEKMNFEDLDASIVAEAMPTLQLSVNCKNKP